MAKMGAQVMAIQSESSLMRKNRLKLNARMFVENETGIIAIHVMI